MANTISNISYANTFGDWVVTTNALVKENNDLAANNFTKPTGTLYLNDPTLGLQSGNTVIAGQLAVQGIGSSAYIQNNLRVDTQVYFTNTVLGLVNSGQANIGGLLFAQGSGTGLLVANTANVGGQLNVTGATRLSNTLTVAGQTQINNGLNVTGNTLISNSMYVTADVHFGNTLSVVANTDVSGYVNVTYDVVANNTSTLNNTHTKTLDVTNTATMNVLQANSSINTSSVTSSTLNVLGSTHSNTVQANTSVTTQSIIATTSTTTPTSNVGILLDANNAAGFFKTIQTTGQISVGGNFVINGTTVYSTNTFTLNAGSGSGLTSYFNVNRGSSGANASFRWNEPSKIFDIIDVDSSVYYRVLTDKQLNDTVTSTSTTTVATANVANTLNNYVATSVNSINNSLAAQNTSIQGSLTTTNARLNAAYTQANSAANTIVGTVGSVSASGSSLSLTSNNGVTIVATSANTLSISTSQDLRTSGTPQFAGLTLSAPLPFSSGGTGATSSAGALNAILPTGTTAGYVLTTGGPGNFYWSAASGGSSGATPGTTINSTRLSYTANGAIATFTTPPFTQSTQVRVYQNGLRQFESEYTLNQSANTITFSTNPANLDAVLIEVDGFIINPYYANNIAYTGGTGSMPISANTIQLAIDSLESRKAALTGATFTGQTIGLTMDANTTNTSFATTAFVKNVLGSGNTFAINAQTVTNGVYTNGSYSDPTWLTISKSKVGLGNVDNTADANKSVSYAASAGAVSWTNVTSRPTALSSFTNDLGNYGGWITASSNQNTQVNSLGVGTASTGTAGEIRATGNITGYYSDDKLKNRIGNIPNALDKVMALNGFYYEANETAQALGYKVKKEVGVSAQEVQAILPEIVVPAPIDDKYLTVHYERLVPLLIEAIKELKAEVEVLKGKN